MPNGVMTTPQSSRPSSRAGTFIVPCTIPTFGCRSRKSISGEKESSCTTVSLLRSSTKSRVHAFSPTLLPPAKPRFRTVGT